MERKAFGQIEEFCVFRVTSRPTSFNIGHAESIKRSRHAKLIRHGKFNALALGAVSKSRVVKFNSVHSSYVLKNCCRKTAILHSSILIRGNESKAFSEGLACIYFLNSLFVIRFQHRHEQDLHRRGG